jgi:lipid II:glycine glycyltransferase (peptidoglycan interpeptide bridge formation enzyme)
VEAVLSDSLEDGDWDEYLARHPLGHHEQTCGFARIRRAHRFDAFRIVARDRGAVVGGAQVLVRRTPAGRFALVSQGPVFDSDEAARAIVSALDERARSAGIDWLRIVAYRSQERIAAACRAHGFAPSGGAWFDEQTSLVDLSLDEQRLLEGMHKKSRYNVKYAVRQGVVVEAGGEADVEAFHRLLSGTASSKAFPVLPAWYFSYLWRLFGTRGKLHLLVARHQGKAVAARIDTIVGDVACANWSAVERVKPDVKANYLVEWEAIRRAKAMGCRWLDVGGVSLDPSESVSQFKRAFGGRLVRHPDPDDKFYGAAAGPRRALFRLSWKVGWMRRKTISLRNRLYGQMAY